MFFRGSVQHVASPPFSDKRNTTRGLKERKLDLRKRAPFIGSQKGWRLRIDEQDDFIDGILCLRNVGNSTSTCDRRG